MVISTDETGSALIRLNSQDGESHLSFKWQGIDGVAFPPNSEVSVPDSRFERLLEQLLQPMGGREAWQHAG